jgi:hypothetical protein
MNCAAGLFDVENSAPIALLFDAKPNELAHRLRALIDSNDQIFYYEGATSTGPNFRVLYCGMEFRVSVRANAIRTDDFARIFCLSDVATANATLTIALGDNLLGGQFVAPIILNLLMFAEKVATGLGAKAVAWTPAQLLSDTAYFATMIGDYAKGGAFPVLSTVKLLFSDGTLQTMGLKWFAGQELELKGEGLSQAEMVRRAVRIVHDIATNGSVLVSQDIPDLDQGQFVRLNPSPEGDQVFAEIISEMERFPL